MFHYRPDQEAPSERILLLRASRSPHGMEFGSITAEVIRRAKKDEPDINRYFDGTNATGYRRATWGNSTKGALFVEDLQVHAQFDLGKDEAPYGEKLIFADAYRIEARDAELMHNTFKKLQKKLDDQEQSYGYVQNVSDLILRFANALGIRTFATFKPGYTSLDYPMNEFNAAHVGDRVSALVREARNS